MATNREQTAELKQLSSGFEFAIHFKMIRLVFPSWLVRGSHTLSLCLLSSLSLLGCTNGFGSGGPEAKPDGSPSSPDGAIEDKTHFDFACPPETCTNGKQWGIGEPIGWNAAPGKAWDVDSQIAQVVALGAPIFRNWGAMSYCFSDANTLVDECAGPIRDTATKLQNLGVLVVQAEGAPPGWMTPDGDGKLPCRDMTPGSPYMELLAKWETAWATLGRYFQTVHYWQIGNEWNIPGSLSPNGCDPDGVITLAERVAYAADLTFYGRKGLRSTHPDAYVFLGSVAPMDDNKTITMAGINQYLEAIYTTIASGSSPSTNVRDYFDGVSWHPYVWTTPTMENWVGPNQSIHSVLESHGDGNIAVWFSEFGNGDFNDGGKSLGNGDDMLQSWMLAQSHLPWLWGVTWFRMLNDPTATWGSEVEKTYGIMGDPTSGFIWKSSAYAMWSINKNIADGSRLVSSFEFGEPNSVSGFFSANVDTLVSTGGNLLGIASSDPQLASPTMQLAASSVQTIEISMSVSGGDTTAQLYFVNPGGAYSEAQAFHFNVTGDGLPHKYTLTTNTVSTWQGTIANVRLDPMDGAGQFLIDSIRFYR